MTTAIEQAKREMYASLAHMKNFEKSGITFGCDAFEIYLEAYLEQLRQQYEEMASTAHSRFESIQSLEAANQTLNGVIEKLSNSVESRGEIIVTLDERLIKMTESRDMFRNLHQAATHASIERAGQASTSGQTSGDRASCEQIGGQKVAIELDGEGLPPVGAVCERNSESGEWVLTKILAHSHLGSVVAYEDVFSPYHLGWCKRKSDFRPIRTLEQIKTEDRDKAINQMEFDTGCLDRGTFTKLYDAGWIKPTCMHSFFAIGDDQMKCTFCGVGK